MKEKPATTEPFPASASPHHGRGGARFHSSSPRNLPVSLLSCCPPAAVGDRHPPVGSGHLAQLSGAAGPVETFPRDRVLPRLLWEMRENDGHVLVEAYIKFLKFAFIEIFLLLTPYSS